MDESMDFEPLDLEAHHPIDIAQHSVRENNMRSAGMQESEIRDEDMEEFEPLDLESVPMPLEDVRNPSADVRRTDFDLSASAFTQDEWSATQTFDIEAVDYGGEEEQEAGKSSPKNKNALSAKAMGKMPTSNAEAENPPEEIHSASADEGRRSPELARNSWQAHTGV